MPPEQPSDRLLPSAGIQVNSRNSHRVTQSWLVLGSRPGNRIIRSTVWWSLSQECVQTPTAALAGDAHRWVTEGAAKISFTRVWLQFGIQDVSKLEDVHHSKQSRLSKCLIGTQPIFRTRLRLCFKLLHTDMETRSNSWLTAIKGGLNFGVRSDVDVWFTLHHSFICQCSYPSLRRPCLLSRPVWFDPTVLLSRLEKWGQKVQLHLGKTLFSFQVKLEPATKWH